MSIQSTRIVSNFKEKNMNKQFLCIALLACTATAFAQVNDRQPQVNPNNSVIVRPNVTIVKKVKFVLTCNGSNLSGLFQPVTNYIPGDHFREVTIDHRLCNNNPDAFIMVTPVRTNPVPFSLYYDQGTQRWKIRIESNGVSDSHKGHASPADKNPIMVTVLDYSPNYLKTGDKFNIMIDNE